jgi:hypothetical protein
MMLNFNVLMPKRSPTASNKTISQQLDIFNCTSINIDCCNVDAISENQNDIKVCITEPSYGKVISMTTHVSADSLKQFYDEVERLTSHID